ncbi:MAG: ComF family protein [Thermodesulfovibrionales bacterium]|nr:ComF family protein [Thermodesulfovibrionales bacterium]
MSVQLIDRFVNLFFPSRCPICRSESNSFVTNPFCSFCWSLIEKYEGPKCFRCGIPTKSVYTTVCSDCLSLNVNMRTIYYGLYQGTLKEAIHLFKFKGLKRLARPLSDLILRLSIPNNCDLIVPVPIRPERLRDRQFNQTALIGYFISKALNIPMNLDILIKIRETKPQTGLLRNERLKNIKNAFYAEKVINGHILLIDDVITSGTTIKECSYALFNGGAKEVTAVALAHSIPINFL